MKINSFKALGVLVVAGVILALSGMASAQSLDEIVVTARKQEENLEDVPISVAAFSAAQLQDMGVNSNEDIAYMTVNYNNVSQLGRRLDRPVIRGMSAPSTFGEPNASFFVDGAYVSGSISTLTLGPIERVEILRGPQSTQFGRATFSGAVNYVTRKPTDEFTGEVTAKLANHESAILSGWASGPIGDSDLSYFLSAGYDQYGGEWNNNLQPGAATDTANYINPNQSGDFSDLGGTETTQLDGKLLWSLSDNTELTFKLGFQRGEDDHYPQLIVETSELNCFVPGQDLQPGDPGYSTSAGAFCGVLESKNRDTRLNLPDIRSGTKYNFWAPAPQPPFPGVTAEDFISQGEKPGIFRDTYTAQVRLDHGFGDWALTALASYNDSEFETAYDLDQTEGRPFTGLFHFYQIQSREDVSFEVRLSSPVDKRIRGSIGVFYYDFERDNRQHSSPGIAQGPLSDPTIATTENIALFGGIEADLSERLTLAIEARVAKDTKEITAPIFCDDPESPFFDPNNFVSDESETEALTPRFSLRYNATDDAMIYAQVAKGNKPGDYNIGYFQDGVLGCATEEALNNPDGVAYVEEEKAWNYEVGTKANWFDRRLTTNLAFFYIDWTNQTVFETRTIPRLVVGAPQSVGVNAGKSDVYGMELETSFAITENLTGSFGYGLSRGKFKVFQSNALEDLTGDGNAAGQRIPNSSEHNVVISLAYLRPVTSTLDWYARSDYSWESGKFTSAENTTEIGERRRWNARTGIETESWRASLFVNNILDEQTPSAILGFPRLTEFNAAGLPTQGYALTPTPGRSIGAEFIWRFGN